VIQGIVMKDWFCLFYYHDRNFHIWYCNYWDRYDSYKILCSIGHVGCHEPTTK